MKVVYIPKKGKDDNSMPKAYRPITLSNFLLKVMEKVIHWFLGERVVALPLPNMHANTRDLGTEMTLLSFSDLVESAFHRGKKSLVISFDCSGAFDRIKFFSAGEALDAAGSPPMITDWYTASGVGAPGGCKQHYSSNHGLPAGGNPIATGVELGNEVPTVNFPLGRNQGHRICGQHHTYCQQEQSTHYGLAHGAGVGKGV